MAYDGTIKVGTRGKLVDFVLWEQSTPTRHSRKTVPLTADTKVGALVKADGTKATAVADIAGICLSEANSTQTLTLDGQLEATILFRDAEVKDIGFEAALAGSAAQLEKVGIRVVPCGL